MITESGIALDISCDNTPRQQVIGGTQAALNEFATLLMAAGYEPVKLGVSGAWHTRLMEDAFRQCAIILPDWISLRQSIRF